VKKLRVGLSVPAFFYPKKGMKKELHCNPSRKTNHFYQNLINKKGSALNRVGFKN
jgi:hypothetical protein